MNLADLRTITGLDAHFAQVGLAGILEAKDAQLIATANHRDNFVVWAAPHAEGAIVGAVDSGRDDHCEWFNAYLKRTDGVWKPQYTGDLLPPSRNIFVIAICKEAYAKLRS